MGCTSHEFYQSCLILTIFVLKAILAAYVWSQLGGADEAFQHDSYTCRSPSLSEHLKPTLNFFLFKFRHFPGSVGWPTQREHGIKNFFGAIGGLTLEMVNCTCTKITFSSYKSCWLAIKSCQPPITLCIIMTSRNARRSAEEKTTLIGLFVSFLDPL